MKRIVILILIFCISCNSPHSNNVVTKNFSKADTLKSLLIGEWGGLGEDSPVWKFSEDSIYYFQEKRSYAYKVLNNDLVIKRDESEGILKNISVKKDTMTFEDPPGIKIK